MVKLKFTVYDLTIALVILLNIFKLTHAHEHTHRNLGSIVNKLISPLLTLETEDSESNESNKKNENESTDYSDDEDTIILNDTPKPTKKTSNKNTVTAVNLYEKYNRLQDKVSRLLKKEQISDTTKNVLNKVFDKMMSNMDKCLWQKKSRKVPLKKSRRTRKSDRAIKMSLLETWRGKFNSLINRYYKQRADSNDMSASKENLELIESLRDLFFEMHNDFQKLVTRYDVLCNVVNEKKWFKSPTKFSVVKNTVRLDEDLTHQKSRDNCEFYIICAQELQEFSKDFYTELMQTVGQVFNNYLKMYLADAPREQVSDKSLLTDVINHVTKHVKKKFNDTFYKEFNTLDLDTESDRKITVEDVKKFFAQTVINIKALIEDVLTKKVNVLPNEIQSTVKQDVITNLDIELGNVQEAFKDKICSSFQTCHGKYVRRMDNSTKLQEFQNSSYYNRNRILDSINMALADED